MARYAARLTHKGPRFNLFTFGNAKVLKSAKKSYLSMVLMLSPWERSGIMNVCPHASPGCIRACLNTAGQGGFGERITADPMKIENRIQRTRRERTELYAYHKAEFFALMIRDIDALIRFARAHVVDHVEHGTGAWTKKIRAVYFRPARKSETGMIPCVRLNGTSDLPWERMPFIMGGRRIPSIVALFPGLQFYDYTKVPGRFVRPGNYYLNYSWNEMVLRPRFPGDTVDYRAQEYWKRGVNPTVVFDRLPASWFGRRVIDGTESDLRFLDPPGVVVGLLPLKFAVNDTTGFVVRTEGALTNPPAHVDTAGLFPDEGDL